DGSSLTPIDADASSVEGDNTPDVEIQGAQNIGHERGADGAPLLVGVARRLVRVRCVWGTRYSIRIMWNSGDVCGVWVYGGAPGWATPLY
ncbi:unnamed protein product, partial [Pylaiella littoralis]